MLCERMNFVGTHSLFKNIEFRFVLPCGGFVLELTNIG